MGVYPLSARIRWAAVGVRLSVGTAQFEHLTPSVRFAADLNRPHMLISLFLYFKYSAMVSGLELS
jgi:hypothetical protein